MGNLNGDYKREAEVFKTIGHPVRLKIIEGLLKNECCVKNIWTSLNLPQATVSQHLALLKNKNIVQAQRKGITMCYSVTDNTVRRVMNVIKKNAVEE